MRQAIAENVKRRLYAESMGKCMNPDCKTELFLNDGDIVEKAHIVPHCKTEDNSFENLIILCPNCHTSFDKGLVFKEDKVKDWKAKRQYEVSIFFAQKFDTFEALEKVIRPLLEENRAIYKNYYLEDNFKLWEKFEGKVLVNNEEMRTLLKNNKQLIQSYTEKEYSNLEAVNQFLLHVDEFRETRGDDEKIRTVLFPNKINSLFGVEPFYESMPVSAESLECLIGKLINDEKFIEVFLGIDSPFIIYQERSEVVKLHIDDAPRLRQMYFKYGCFRKTEIRLKSLNFALSYMNNNNIQYAINNLPSLSDIVVREAPLKFIYKYCLSKAELISLAPQVGLVIVNLHNWNGEGCISQAAYVQAEIMNVKLLTMNSFYKYVHRS